MSLTQEIIEAALEHLELDPDEPILKAIIRDGQLILIMADHRKYTVPVADLTEQPERIAAIPERPPLTAAGRPETAHRGPGQTLRKKTTPKPANPD